MTSWALQDRYFRKLITATLFAFSSAFINSFPKTVSNKTSLSLPETMRYVSFPRSPVLAAYDHERFSRGSNSSGSHWLWKNYSNTQNSVIPFRSYHSLFPTKNSFAVTTWRVATCSPSPVFLHASSMWHSPGSLQSTKSPLQLLKEIGSVKINDIKYFVSWITLKFQIYK